MRTNCCSRAKLAIQKVSVAAQDAANIGLALILTNLKTGGPKCLGTAHPNKNTAVRVCSEAVVHNPDHALCPHSYKLPTLCTSKPHPTAKTTRSHELMHLPSFCFSIPSPRSDSSILPQFRSVCNASRGHKPTKTSYLTTPPSYSSINSPFFAARQNHLPHSLS